VARHVRRRRGAGSVWVGSGRRRARGRIPRNRSVRTWGRTDMACLAGSEEFGATGKGKRARERNRARRGEEEDGLNRRRRGKLLVSVKGKGGAPERGL
jgi:hypothetical protein